jgi:hypothetical protein
VLENDVYSKPLIVIKYHDCIQPTLEGLWVRKCPTMIGTSSLPLVDCVSFGLSFTFLFVSPMMVLAINLLLDFYLFLVLLRFMF